MGGFNPTPPDKLGQVIQLFEEHVKRLESKDPDKEKLDDAIAVLRGELAELERNVEKR